MYQNQHNDQISIKNIWINLLSLGWSTFHSRTQNEEILLSLVNTSAQEAAALVDRREQPAAYSSAPILMGMIMGNKSGANGISQIDSLHNE
jgi:hypothetical protein